MSAEQPEMFPSADQPDWGDLPTSATMTRGEELEFQARAWTAFCALHEAVPETMRVRAQGAAFIDNRDWAHLLAAALYARCRIRDRRAGWE